MWVGLRASPYGIEGADRPMRRMVQGRGLRRLARVGAMALAAAVLIAGALNVAATLTPPQHDAFQLTAETTPQSWMEINHPIALYDLSGTEFAKLPRVFRARRHLPDGGREDVLTFGAPGSSKPYLRLSLLRTKQDPAVPNGDGHDAEGHETLADDLARLAGLGDQSVTALHSTSSLSTRLGIVTVANLQLWDDGLPQQCLGFRGFPGGSDGLRLTGFACGVASKPIGRSTLACAIDRIDLLSAGDDRRLRAIFVAAEREPGSSCAEGRTRSAGGLMTAVGARTTWLDQDADLPPLRGILEAATASLKAAIRD